MKNRVVALLLSTVLAASIITGCGGNKDENVRERQTREETDSSLIEQNITPVSSQTVDIDITVGDEKTKDQQVAEDIYFFAKEIGVSEDKVLSYYLEDYDNDGSYEAFAFVGEVVPGDEYMPDEYTGDVYYIGKDGAKLIKEGNMGFATPGEILDFGSRKYFIIEESYTTSLVTFIYSASNGDYMEDSYSGVGDLGKINGNDFTIMISAYDAEYDKEMDYYLGHTWKDYYFHYSKEEDCIKEYEGETITIEEASDMLPAGIMDIVMNQDYEIINAIYRENGILNINYKYEDENSIVYGNVNYDTVEEEFLAPWGNAGDTAVGWEDSNYGGIYTRTIYTD